MDTIDNLIQELNKLSKYGVTITNQNVDKDFDTALEMDDNDLKNVKVEWRVTSYFNPIFGDMSYSAFNKDLKLALQEVIDWLKENVEE